MTDTPSDTTGGGRTVLSSADDRLAYALAAGHYSPVVCCRMAGIPPCAPETAQEIIAHCMKQKDFADRVDYWAEVIGAELQHKATYAQQTRNLTRDWVLAKAKHVYRVAMGEAPLDSTSSGEPVYIKHPNFAAGLRALAQISHILHLAGHTAEDETDDLALEIAELQRRMADGVPDRERLN